MTRIIPYNDSTITVESFSTLAQCAQRTQIFLHERFVGLSGGTTYLALYPHWRDLQPDVANTIFLPVDERKVPFDDPSSNWGAANKHFFEPLGLPSSKNNFVADARSYQNLLSKYFASADPVFDTVFLGIGNDGHIASLFPGSQHLDDRDSTVLDTISPLPPHERTTLALKPLIAAKNLIIIVATTDKKEILNRVWKNDLSLPVVRLLNKRSNSMMFLEESLMP